MNTLFATQLLLHLPDVGVATYWRLLDSFKSIDQVIAAPAEILRDHLPAKAFAVLDEYRNTGRGVLADQLARDSDFLHAHDDVHLIGIQDPLYPSLLREIPKAPPLLYVRGNPAHLSLPQIAMVGTRNPTPSGQEMALQFARYLSTSGFAITSGLALGVDAAAHEGALAGSGVTIAVMGTGIDSIYPSRHKGLADSIVRRGGCLVSEFAIGTSAHASNFPQRNRLISGLSIGLLVVEAALKSGSLITASYALQHNREVFAIPGSIHNPQARGCHQLIRQGATLVEQASDIVDQLHGLLQYKRAELAPGPRFSPGPSHMLEGDFDCNESQLLKAMGYDPVPMDILLGRVSMDVGVVIACLMGLEIKGAVQQTAQGYVRVAS